MPDGASFFASLCSSMISARGMNCAASAEKRIISTAPMAKFGAWKSASPRSFASSPSSASSNPVVPTTHGTPCSSAARTFACPASGVVKSTAASSPATSIASPISMPCTSWPARSSAGPSVLPTFPSAPKSATLMPPPV